MAGTNPKSGYQEHQGRPGQRTDKLLILKPEQFYKRTDYNFVFRMDLVANSRKMAFFIANQELEARGDGDYAIVGIIENPTEKRPSVMERTLIA